MNTERILEALTRGLECAYSLHCEPAHRDQLFIEEVIKEIKAEIKNEDQRL